VNILAKKQRTAEWLQARCGKITASRIADVMNFRKPTKADIEAGVKLEGADRRNYRMELLAERLTSIPADHYVSKYMEFGAEYEDDARRAYELKAEVMIDQTGFVGHPALDYAGASPDGLIDEDGLLELKVPKSETHLGYLFANEVPEEYRQQMIFNMTCCERQWADFVSYDPRLPEPVRMFVKRLHWKEAAASEIDAAVQQFNIELEATIERLRQLAGPFDLPAAQAPAPEDDIGDLGISAEDIAWAQRGFTDEA
jgi:putative phage-type endonuclease